MAAISSCSRTAVGVPPAANGDPGADLEVRHAGFHHGRQFGRTDERRLVVASPRTLPARTCGAPVVTKSKNT
jgi:hypothetical protein